MRYGKIPGGLARQTFIVSQLEPGRRRSTHTEPCGQVGGRLPGRIAIVPVECGSDALVRRREARRGYVTERAAAHSFFARRKENPGAAPYHGLIGQSVCET